MSTDSLNGVIGQPGHFAGDYMFKALALPNASTIYSEEKTLNNTLGRLQIVGTIDTPLTIAQAGHLTVVLENKKSDGTWEKYADVFAASNQSLLTGQMFAIIPVPHDTKRIFRLAVTSDFDASAVKLTAAIETLPMA